MNLKKKFLLITTLAVVIFAAIAVDPAYMRNVIRPVRAAANAASVVTVTCGSGTIDNNYLNFLVSFQDSDVAELSNPVLVVVSGTQGESCAAALNAFYSLGYTRQDFSFIPLPTSSATLVGAVGEFWVLTRGYQP